MKDMLLVNYVDRHKQAMINELKILPLNIYNLSFHLS